MVIQDFRDGYLCNAFGYPFYGKHVLCNEDLNLPLCSEGPSLEIAGAKNQLDRSQLYFYYTYGLDN